MKLLDLSGIHVAFNGPPYSGKDTLAAMLVDATHAQSFEFKARLIEIAIAIAGVSSGQWNAWYQQDKDQPRPELKGHSCRSFINLIAEDMIKPNLGSDFFASSVWRQAIKEGSGCIYTDMGYQVEAAEGLTIASSHSIVVVRLFRDGYEYSTHGDTRNYINEKLFKYRIVFLDVHCKEGGLVEAFNDLLSELSSVVASLRSGESPESLSRTFYES